MTTQLKSLKQIETNKFYTNTGDARVSLLDENGNPSQYGYNNPALANPGSILLRDMGTLLYSNNNTKVLRKVQDIQTGQILYIPTLTDQISVPTVDNAIWIDGIGNEEIRNITEDKDGNVYIVGRSNTTGFSIGGVTRPSVGFGGFVAKLTPQLTYLWANWIDGVGDDLCYDVSVDNNGNVYVSGLTRSPNLNIGGAVNPAVSDRNAFIAKYNSDGVIQWGRILYGQVTGPNTGQEYGKTIVTDANGNIYTSGYSSSVSITIIGTGAVYNKPTTSTGDTWFYIMKFDTNGQNVWMRSIDSNNSDEYDVNKSAVDSFGNVYISGYSYSNDLSIQTLNGTVTRPTTNNSSAAFIVKVLPNGDFQWASFIDGVNDELSFSLAVDKTNFVYCTGYTNTNGLTIITSNGRVVNPTNISPYKNGFLVKFSPQGNIELARFLFSSSFNTEIYSSYIDSNMDIFISGSLISSTGNVPPFSVTTASGIVQTNPGTNQVFIPFEAKYNSYGVLQWMHFIEGDDLPGQNVGQAVSKRFNHLYSVGITSLINYSFSGPNGTYTRPSSGFGGYLVKYNLTKTVPSINSFVVSN